MLNTRKTLAVICATLEAAKRKSEFYSGLDWIQNERIRTKMPRTEDVKVAYYSFCTVRALICAAQGTRKHHACAKSREPAEEIPRAQKQNGGYRKNFLVFQVGSKGVLQ